MKKITAFILLITGNSQAQLNLDWGSYITLEHPAIADSNQLSTNFGWSLASINGELVIGAPLYDIGLTSNAGSIYYLRSAANGIIKPLDWESGNGRFSQSNISDSSVESGDFFGFSVAIINTKNTKKVLIGTPREDIGSISNAGMFHEMFINSKGVDFLNYDQNTDGIQGNPAQEDTMGLSVALGDFNNDGNIDAAIGSPGESVDAVLNVGAVNVIMGGADGILDTNNTQLWTQASMFIEGIPLEDDEFGRALAVGDFNADSYDDLAVGVPRDAVKGLPSAGSVNVIYGSNEGLQTTGNQLWNQNSAGISDIAEEGDNFGLRMAVGDYNGDGVDDLAIGAPFENIDNISNAGVVHVILGTKSEGLVALGNQFISQAEPGFTGNAEQDDSFGLSLAAGKLNNDDYDDLVIGTPGESFTDIPNAGAAFVVHGSSTGLQYNDEYIISEDNFSIPGGLRPNRSFGWAVTVNDFDNDGKDDLAITSLPFFDSFNSQHSVIVAYRVNHDSIFKNGFE